MGKMNLAPENPKYTSLVGHPLTPEDRLENYLESDEAFNKLYPLPIQILAHNHWTPLDVSRTAAQFLAVESGVRILDVGCGVGKFCLSAAYYAADAEFFGVEQRKKLVSHAERAQQRLGVRNVTFKHANFTQLDFSEYDHFYFFNSFYENLDETERIDDTIDYSIELFDYYSRYLYHALDQKPAGTRIATYHSLEDEIPPGYHVVGSEKNNLLKFWVKV